MILTRGARITGAVLCAVLAALVAAWIVRDLRAVGDASTLLRYWAGYTDGWPRKLPATLQADPVLLGVYVLALLAALRSSVAASALVVTGLVTLVLRLPGLWIIGSSWTGDRFGDDLRTRALVGTFVTLAAGLALVVTGAAGRRRPEDMYERPPTRPGRGAGVTAFLVLGASGAVLIAWEIRQLFTLARRGLSRLVHRRRGADTRADRRPAGLEQRGARGDLPGGGVDRPLPRRPLPPARYDRCRIPAGLRRLRDRPDRPQRVAGTLR
ncbi:hypothetical protein [[Kitasatospora] papulosa]|uniref:hypothetical protein n=1 Tax=[Kitasatospora] papulosa TaxID=1464011 RepID=UPI002E2AB5BD|nr:hypothetical protein [[Kitasatospora] papulosa]